MRNVIYAVLMVINSLSLAYMIGITITYFLQLLYSGKALNEYVKYLRFSDYRRYIDSANMIPVSLIVPAYNEEATVTETVKNLLKLNYPEYEIIVVNDGSKDSTLPLLIEKFGMVLIDQPFKQSVEAKPVRAVYRTPLHANLMVVDKENGGKADALNAGINFSRYPVVVSMDADSVLEKEALVRIMSPFLQDNTVVAVGGVVRIANGCVIEGEVVNSILFRRVVVEKGARIENSIIMQNSDIRENCTVENVITDKSVVLTEGTELKGSPKNPVVVGKGSIL